jgi:predicted DCC family thiol-disulfide oxidoreductase YuxK
MSNELQQGASEPGPIILYDGVCGLCNRLNRFVLRRDRQEIFRFASLQSQLAADILNRHSASPQALDTVYVVLNYGQQEERLLSRSEAVIFVLKQLGGVGRIAGYVLACLPRPLRDWGYGLVARNRYRLFGRFDTCPLPCPNQRARFLDL